MSSTGSRGVWWLSPVGAVCLLTLPTLWLASRTPDPRYRFAWGSPKELTGGTVLLVLTGALIFMLTSALPQLRAPEAAAREWPGLMPAQVETLARAAGPLFWLTLVGYAGLVLSGIRHGLTPVTVLQALAGQNVFAGTIKETVGSVPGLTSLTQVGVAFVVIATLVLLYERDVTLRRRLVVLVVLGLVRSLLLSERLATLELVIPICAVVAFRQASLRRPGRRRIFVLVAPVLLIPMVLIVFGAFEYSRSWVFYSSRTSSSYAQFTVERLAGYYATAYNNGQLALNYEVYPGRLPYGSVEALWTAPGASLFGGYPHPGGEDPIESHARVLELHGNPEFNSPGGLVIPFIDWGPVGGLVYLGLAGVLLGSLYRRCVAGRPFAVVLFPSVTTGLYELPRYIYWSLGRYTPGLVALCVVGWLLVKQTADGRDEPVTDLAAAAPRRSA